MSVVALRDFENASGTAYTPSDPFEIFAEDLNSLKAAIGGGWTNPLSLVTVRDSIDTLSLYVQGVERIDGLGFAYLRTILPDADISYDLGDGALRWKSVFAGQFVGGGTGLTGVELLSRKNVANGYCGLDAGGLVPVANLPAISITNTFVVASQAAMLALVAQTGDVAVRTDTSTTYILRGSDPTLLGDWELLLTPVDSVLSVFGRTGIVVATSGDYNAGQITNTPAGTIASTDVQAALNELDTEKVPTTRTISTTSPLAGGGDLSANRTLSLGTVPVTLGGTNITTYAIGDLIYCSAADVLSKLGIGTAGQVLTVAGGLPVWSSLAAVVTFATIGGGTNTTSAMVVGTGASLGYSGSGSIDATKLLGKTWAIPDPIGATTPNSGAFTTLFSSGGLKLGFRATAVSISAAVTDTIISCTAVPVTITLPPAATAGAGFVLVVKDATGNASGASPITIDGDGAETIDGQTTKEIRASWGSYSLYSTGSAWRVF